MTVTWTVYIGMDCGCSRGPFHSISTQDKDNWMDKRGEPIFCDKHSSYPTISWVGAHGN